VGPNDRFEHLSKAVLADPELQARLRSLRDWPEFVAATLDAATERGLSLTGEDLEAARIARRRTWLERWV
jgi:hypothetical protein